MEEAKTLYSESQVKENEALIITQELWNKLLELEEKHPDDMQEHRKDIHNIQNRIMARSCKFDIIKKF